MFIVSNIRSRYVIICAYFLSCLHNLPLFATHPTKPPLFNHYKRLEKILPYVPLGIFPTPLYDVTTTYSASCHTIKNVYIKDDAILPYTNPTASHNGCGYLRKLEYLFADAIQEKATALLITEYEKTPEIMYAYSLAKQLGFEATIMATHNPCALNSDDSYKDVSQYNYKTYKNSTFRDLEIFRYARQCITEDKPLPYLIPDHGTSIIGNIGFVNAAFELKDQLNQHIQETPTIIYIPYHTGGSAAGLLVGLQAAKIPCLVKLIPNNPHIPFVEKKFSNLIKKTNEYLHELDPSFPLFSLDSYNFEYREDLSAQDSTDTLFEKDIASQDMHHKTIVLWHTKNIT